jgi:hypothetical protein
MSIDWIKCSERMPEENRTHPYLATVCLICVNEDLCRGSDIAHLERDNRKRPVKWVGRYKQYSLEEVSHWAEINLPEEV